MYRFFKLIMLPIELLAVAILCFVACDYIVLTVAIILIIVQICIFEHIDSGKSKAASDNTSEEYDKEESSLGFKKSLLAFQANREEDLTELLHTLSVARQNLSIAIESKDSKEISKAEQELSDSIDSVMNFFENYSNFGITLHKFKP